MRMWIAVVMALSLSFVTSAFAEIELQATLDTAQEVPAPQGTNPGEGGTASFLFNDEDKSLQYDVNLHDLTSAPVLGHLHKAPVGVVGDVVIPLNVPSAATGEVSGTVTGVPSDLVDALLSG